jgi:hypothetical protein
MQYINLTIHALTPACSCPLSCSMFGKGEEGIEALYFLYLSPSLLSPSPIHPFLDTRIKNK